MSNFISEFVSGFGACNRAACACAFVIRDAVVLKLYAVLTTDAALDGALDGAGEGGAVWY